MKTKEYLGPVGFTVEKEKLQIYGNYLEKLADQCGGYLTPEEILSFARKKRNPLHDFFDWDDSSASEKWRLHQARNLLHIRIKIIDNDNEHSIRQFHRIKINMDDSDKEGLAYVPLEIICGKDEYLQQIIEKAHNELIRWGVKYDQYKKLKPAAKDVLKIAQRLKTENGEMMAGQ
jgi:hypothetical protein